jgi:hypothetical protein
MRQTCIEASNITFNMAESLFCRADGVMIEKKLIISDKLKVAFALRGSPPNKDDASDTSSGARAPQILFKTSELASPVVALRRCIARNAGLL